MNNFLDNLRNLETGDDSDNFQLIEVIRDAANNLGENARRMLEIGILQDELTKLGFKYGILTLSTMNRDCQDKNKYLSIYFSTNDIVIANWRGEVITQFIYSPTWQQNVLTKIKEIINHD